MSQTLAERFVAFFVNNFPPWRTLAVGGPLSLLWAALCLLISGTLKARCGLKTGYSRKVFHFLIFTSVVGIHSLWGTPVVCLFGGMTSLVVLYAILRGDGHLLYEAMAREKDAPHRTYFIVAPYVATLIGGLASNMLFGPAAVLGYLVTGLGDAVGEPVGVRFGRHAYSVPSLRQVPTTRTLEGSAAVFLASTLGILAGIAVCPDLRFTTWSPLSIPLLGAACALVEALSPHGWDNALMQLVPSLLGLLLFSQTGDRTYVMRS